MPKFVVKKCLDGLETEPKDPPTAMKAVLEIVFKHTAEVFELIVDAISEKYKIDKAEMMDVILKNPAYLTKATCVELEAPPKVVKKKFKISNPQDHQG